MVVDAHEDINAQHRATGKPGALRLDVPVVHDENLKSVGAFSPPALPAPVSKTLPDVHLHAPTLTHRLFSHHVCKSSTSLQSTISSSSLPQWQRFDCAGTTCGYMYCHGHHC